MTKAQKTFIIAILAVLLAVIAVGQSCAAPAAYAVTVTESNFDNTVIEDDLADLDLQYVTENYSDVSIIELVEYCYSDNVFKQGNYGLYLYVYVPERTVLSIRTGANTVNIAVEYTEDTDIESGETVLKPSRYENLSLTYLDKSGGEYENMFYKFKVTDPGEILVNAKRCNTEYGERRYDIAGIQLQTMGESLPSDHNVGGTWHYTGFAKGYGEDENAESTLECEQTDLTTLRLSPKHTYYNTDQPKDPGTASNTGNIYDRLSSVYFSVPNDILSLYGDLSAVHAEWYEYRTKPIYVTANEKIYNKFIDNIGKTIPYQTEDSGSPFCYDPEIEYGFAADYSHFNGMSSPHFDYAYNVNDTAHSLFGNVDPNSEQRASVLQSLYWVFLSETENAGDYTLPSETIREYAEYHSAGKTDLINDTYSMSMFSEDVGDGRTAGYNNVNIWRDTVYSLEEIPAQSFWEKFFGIHDDSVFDNVEAIQRVTPEDLSSGDPATICDRLYIADADYDDFKAYYDNATKNDETVFMFRFACTDYYSAQCWEFPNDVSNSAAGGYFSGMNAYLAYMNVFLDFDIIDVTFSMDGVYTVIPVVSDPIDIFSDVTPPPVFSEGLKWWQVLLIILGIILVVYLVVKFVGWITGRTKTVKVKVRHYKK